MTSGDQAEARASGTGKHPVADNPLRILKARDWAGVDDLRRSARTLRLVARRGAGGGDEPCVSMCPRTRSHEDYLAAEAALASPGKLALALAFSVSSERIGHWSESHENVWGAANIHLLRAESLPQGDSVKARHLIAAFRIFDQDALEEHILNACTEAMRLTGAHVDVHAALQDFQREVIGVIERAISNFGDEIDASELDLLEAIEGASTFPEIGGLRSALSDVIERQASTLFTAYETAGEVIDAQSEKQPVSTTALQKLICEAQNASGVLRQIAEHPLVARKFDEGILGGITTRLSIASWRLGMNDGMWAIAAQLVSGLQSKHVRSQDEFTRDACRVIIRIAPVMAKGSRAQRLAEIDDVVQDYPRLLQHMLTLRVLTSVEGRPPALPTRPTPIASAQPSPLEPSDEPGFARGVGVFIFIIVLIVGWVLVVTNTPSPASRRSPSPPPPSAYTPPPARPVPSTTNTTASRRSRMSASMDLERNRIDRMESDLNSLRSELDRDKALGYVDLYNSKVDRYNRDLVAYEAAVDSYYLRVQRFNQRRYDP